MSKIGRIEKPVEISWIPGFYEPIDARLAARRVETRAWSVSTFDEVLPGPEKDPDGWISRLGPDRRRYWHHRSLGPAPWEADPEAFAVGLDQVSASGDSSSTTTAATSRPLPSPDEEPEGWLTHRSADGRVSWHHHALGLAPWEAMGAAPDTDHGNGIGSVAAEVCRESTDILDIPAEDTGLHRLPTQLLPARPKFGCSDKRCI